VNKADTGKADTGKADTGEVGADRNVLRAPESGDGKALHGLIAACPPLDVNTGYAYQLLVRHFAATSIVASEGDELVGAITGYRLPEEPSVLFVWQVAVHQSQRGRGLAGRMLDELFQRCRGGGVTSLQTTIGPDNKASRRLFERFAECLGCEHRYEPFLSESDLEPGHDAEELLRIGPLPAGTA